MRLKNMSTLEYYLQELGAVNALTALDETCARKVRSAASFYNFLLAAQP